MSICPASENTIKYCDNVFTSKRAPIASNRFTSDRDFVRSWTMFNTFDVKQLRSVRQDRQSRLFGEGLKLRSNLEQLVQWELYFCKGHTTWTPMKRHTVCYTGGVLSININC